MWKSDLILGNFALTWDMQTEMNMAIRVCTIYSFKGLESAVVILTELYKLRPDIASQLVYVGLSRARHHAVVLGELPEPNQNQWDEA
jgi:ATP-dependent exoDNAse (exonuclease V) beta subunit